MHINSSTHDDDLAFGKPAGSPGPQRPTMSAWLAVLSVGVGAFALVTTEFLPVGLLPQIAAELHLTEGQAGQMVTVPGIIAAFAALFVTVGAGRADRRHVLLALTALMVISNAIVALAPTFGSILFGRALLGIGVGGFWAIGVAVSSRLVPAPSAAKATAIIFAGISLGTVAGVPAGAFIGELLGWRVAFGAAGAIGVLVLLTQFLLLPSLPTLKPILFSDLPKLLRIPKARLGLTASVLMFIGQFSAYTYISPFLKQVTGMSPASVSALLLTYGVAGFIGNIAGGWAVSKDGRNAVIGMALVLGLSTLAMPLFGANAVGATVLVAIWGLGFGAMPITLQSWMFNAAPDAMEGGGALFVATVQVALAGGALVGGAAVDNLGVPSAMLVGGSFALATAVLMWRRGRERAPIAAAPAAG